MRAHVYICDQCGAQRKDGNHWYGQLPNVSTFIAYKWDQVLELEKSGIEVKHLCSDACLLKSASAWGQA
jgi:hypothetical protein